ncbi:MAG: reductive dehalogenase [Deltaproteobacteria bacterium]|nr:reductive dehalogenase [Deltaproteobacteria bacterium]
MIRILVILTGAALTLQALIGLSFFLSSVWERERRAAILGGLQFLVMAGVFILFLYLERLGVFRSGPGPWILLCVLLAGGIIIALLVRRTAPNKRALEGTRGLIVGEVRRQDERETVFARNRSLRPGTERYSAFYREHPEYEEFDAKRRLPGGISGPPGRIDKPHEVPNVAATLAQQVIALSLSAPERVRPNTAPPLRGKAVKISPREAALRVKGFARHMGADLVGITRVNPLWFYSNRGEIFNENWEDWGKEIPVEHEFAVVFATEMSLDMIATSPHTPTSIESNCQYAKGAAIATQLASYIANLGYSATANHFRHYEALMVPLAVDAGLGELSRMGYLVTKEFGPRVRLAAVTTNMPLVPDKPVDLGVEDFCRICKKCAVCCPSGSIPMGEQREVNGTLRWKLDAESCFEYWGKIGTGCNVCMRVCPWSHARTFPHRLIVELVSRNSLSRRLFTIMDDLFYGRIPKPRKGPEWAKFWE